MLALRLYIITSLAMLFLNGEVNAQEMSWKSSGKGGAVAAGGEKAVEAGISMLEQGGNAADAAVATVIALSITDYGAFTIGAEAACILYDAKKSEVKTLSGIGNAPLDPKAIEWYYQNGIPDAGGFLKAAPIPGVMSMFFKALQVYGTMSFEKVVAPSLALLDAGGKDWYQNLAITLRKLVETERKTQGTREEKLQAARDRFYKGDIADVLETFYIENGGFLRKADLAAYQTLIEDPVKVNYKGYTICKCSTWTQGPCLCETLRLLEGYDLKKMGHLSADYIHVITEALKLGLADRDMYYGDPLFANVPMDALLSDRYTAIRRPLIDMTKASPDVRPGDPIAMKALKTGGVYTPGEKGTTTCVVADKWGNIIAVTPSGNQRYTKCESLGIEFGNRLRCLNTTPNHPNSLEPGKRPRITLTPTIVLKDGKGILGISVAGGDVQDQTTLNCLLNFIEFGMMPEKAVTTPRFNTGHHQDSFKSSADRKETYVKLSGLTLNDTISIEVRNQLAARGHIIDITKGPIANPVMIYLDPASGVIYGAGDPKSRRHAAALETTSR